LRILGIDIGVHGAIAILDDAGRLLEIEDMPTLYDGPKGRSAVNAVLLAAWARKCGAELAYVESVGARPLEGAVGAFAFGRSRGVVEGVLAACGIPARFLTPARWKGLVGLRAASKDASRGEAVRRWPAQAYLFRRVKDDGRAEAALIAIAGLSEMRENFSKPSLQVVEDLF
jgi:crossover junction endodeoxyribonuclease RuvC